MNKKTFIQKSNGDTLEASEWNELTGYVNEAVDVINAGGSGDSVVSTEVDPLDADKTFVKIGSVTVAELTSKGEKGTNVGLSGDNNINIEPRPAAGDGSGKNTPGLANRKGGNIALKPGDDIEFWGHKRGSSKSDEVSVKIMTEVPKASDPTKTDEVAAKLQLNAGDIVLTSKDKQTQSDEMNITVNKAADTRGYLKVRAQAIDLRCEENGGIALQPKGEDGNGHENKIKFEHNGGDGKEFGTFNTEKTSIFTDEYRFNKNGTVYAVTRGELETTYKVPGDPTSGVKKIDYPTQSDDFKDIITQDTPHFTWEQIFEAIDSAKRVIDVSSDSEYFNQSQQVVEIIPQAVLERFPFELIGRRTLLLDDGSHLYNATVRREMVNPTDPSDGTCIYTIEAVGTDKKIQIKVYSNTPQPLSQGVTKATYCEAEIGQSFPTYNPAT